MKRKMKEMLKPANKVKTPEKGENVGNNGEEGRKRKTRKIKERARGKRKQKGGKPRLSISIRTQLIVGFIIPIAFIIAVGVVSYTKASEGLTGNYESSSRTALEMTVATLEESMKMIETATAELANDGTVKAYALGGYSGDSVKEAQAKNTLRTNLSVKETSSDKIEALHILPVGDGIVLTSKTLSANEIKSFISEIPGSEDKILLEDNRMHWGTSHPFINKFLEMDESEYILFCSKNFATGENKGLVIVDVSRKAIAAVLEQLDVGENSQVSFITAEGEELKSGGDVSIAETDFFIKGKESGEDSIAEYVKYNGTQYFFMMCKSKTTGAYVTVMVPRSVITASTRDIRQITIWLVVAACIVAALISYIIIMNITRNIHGSVLKLDKVSHGELLEETGNTKKAGNEFGKLHGAISNTVSRMRELVLTVKKMIGIVSVSGEKVSDSSRNVGNMVTDMSAQVEEILSTIQQEDQEIANCNDHMEELSVNIKTVSSSIMSTIEEVDNSKQVIIEGIRAVEDMTRQSRETSDATDEVQGRVMQLGGKLNDIAKAVENIQEIASQTNLLSLNASIEAARAGEHGRGFSVVAEEIRKLADSSASMADSIQKTIEEVREYSVSAIDKVQKAESIVAMQEESVGNTAAAFQSINDFMEKLVKSMEQVSVDVEEMNQKRKGALHSIHVISRLSEGTVQSANVVGESLQQQVESANTLEGEARSLEENMEELKLAISSFKLVKEEVSEKDRQAKKGLGLPKKEKKGGVALRSKKEKETVRPKKEKKGKKFLKESPKKDSGTKEQ